MEQAKRRTPRVAPVFYNRNIPTALRASIDQSNCILTVVDGDNFYDFLKSFDHNPLDLINLHVKNRPSHFRPIFFYTLGCYNKDKEIQEEFIKKLKNDELNKLDVCFMESSELYGFKGYSDFELFVYILKRIKYFNTLLLFTSDSDFLPMIEYLYKEYGKVTELYFNLSQAKEILLLDNPEIGLIKTHDISNDYYAIQSIKKQQAESCTP